MCRADELIHQLTTEEITSLRELGRGPARRKIPFSHAERFIDLGLAELNCGYQELTRQGKRALVLLEDDGGGAPAMAAE